MALHVSEYYIILPLFTSRILHINYLNCLDYFSIHSVFYVVHQIYR